VNSAAFIVGERGGPGAVLQDIARTIGFLPAERFTDIGRAEAQSRRTPLVFFLCAAVYDLSHLKPIATTIRSSAVPTIKFSPLIYFAHDLSVENIARCVMLGFDDIISLPMAPGALRERLSRQIGRQQIYYETPSFFGPDRRNRFGTPARTGGSDRGGGAFRRIELVRNTLSGVEILSDDNNEFLL
jgi:hypothetical protein